jgi:hypothetical protein
VGGLRAKDADRDRYVDIIESAYVDGQLGEHDRELRVSRALTAETLDELDALTGDLQNQPAPVVVQRAPAPRPVPATSNGFPLKGLGVAAVATFVLAVLALAPSGEPEADQATGQVGSISVRPVDYALSARDLNTFVRRYQDKFDTSNAYGVTFFPARVVADVPASGSGPRVEEWSWDGDWRRVEDAQPVDRPADTVALRMLDVAALFENIEVATTDLGVSDAEVQRVEVRSSPDGRGLVTIHVRNGLAEAALLETTLQGSRVRAVPHDG